MGIYVVSLGDFKNDLMLDEVKIDEVNDKLDNLISNYDFTKGYCEDSSAILNDLIVFVEGIIDTKIAYGNTIYLREAEEILEQLKEYKSRNC